MTNRDISIHDTWWRIACICSAINLKQENVNILIDAKNAFYAALAAYRRNFIVTTTILKKLSSGYIFIVYVKYILFRTLLIRDTGKDNIFPHVLRALFYGKGIYAP